MLQERRSASWQSSQLRTLRSSSSTAAWGRACAPQAADWSACGSSGCSSLSGSLIMLGTLLTS